MTFMATLMLYCATAFPGATATSAREACVAKAIRCTEYVPKAARLYENDSARCMINQLPMDIK